LGIVPSQSRSSATGLSWCVWLPQNGFAFLADAATLKVCLMAPGQTAPFATAFIALISASIVVTLCDDPGGPTQSAHSILSVYFLINELKLSLYFGVPEPRSASDGASHEEHSIDCS